MCKPKIEITILEGDIDISIDNLSRSQALALLQSAINRLIENEMAQLKFEYPS